MFYVGIDIAKYKHDFAIINNDGFVIVPPKTIQNSEEGFHELLSSLLALDRSQGIKIGLEATGHYESNLKTFLSKQGFDFIELNPLQVSRFHSQISLRRTKTDKVDCFVIAHFIIEQYKPIALILAHIGLYWCPLNNHLFLSDYSYQ